jgi:hypothetical protein
LLRFTPRGHASRDPVIAIRRRIIAHHAEQAHVTVVKDGFFVFECRIERHVEALIDILGTTYWQL